MTKIDIFLSYRRDDSLFETKNIHSTLKQAGYAVWMDTTEIQAGDDWPDEIQSALKDSKVILAVIGEKWLKCQQKDGRRRLDNEKDWVRLELGNALQANKRIIPVLLNNTFMPSIEDLPEPLKSLSNRQLIKLTKDNWESDLQNLLNKIPHEGFERPANKPKFLLTSESPRRKELLQQIGWEENNDYFTIHASLNPDTENEQQLNLSKAKKIAEKTARRKINWVIEQSIDRITERIGKGWNPSETIIIGVDTIVFCKDKILDRPLLKSLQFAGPKDVKEARKRAKEMLMEQKGESVYIITSMAVATADDYQHPAIETIVTEAELRSYTETEIDNYIFYAEPFDKAGALGIQEKGVSLFKKIKGSYTNSVGLPLQEFISLLEKNYGTTFRLPELRSTLKSGVEEGSRSLSVVCVGDINYDFVYHTLPQDFFSKLGPPGKKILDSIDRSVGGTAVNFAKGAKRTGFKPCYVVGVIGGDALGQEISRELHHHDITPIFTSNPNQKTSIAIILRDTAKEDISITLTDSDQSLPEFVVNLAQSQIQESDVLYCSGYCLIDPNRYTNALKMLRTAKEAGRIVILDVVVGMSREVSLDALANTGFSDKNNGKLVDICVSEFPEVFDWCQIDIEGNTELEIWETNKETLIHQLRGRFPVTILRTSKYTHEVVITPDNVIGPYLLDYSSLKAHEKIGYGDFRTAKQAHSFLSPRIVLASKSPQRLNLLSQIVAPSKIEVEVSNYSEEKKPYETPYDRVQRLAMAKAETVFEQKTLYHDDIELIIGADTEIIRELQNDEWEMIGHPTNTEEAIRDLAKLSGQTHIAITGIAVIGKDPQTGNLKKLVEFVETQVTFADLDPQQIRTYAETGEPIGRAGAYAIQGLGAMLIKNLEGSYSNVVGLPLERLSEILTEEFDKPIWKFDKISNWTFPDPIKTLR